MVYGDVRFVRTQENLLGDTALEEGKRGSGAAFRHELMQMLQE